MTPLVAVGGLLLTPIFALGGLLAIAAAGMSGSLAPSSATDVAIQQIPASMLDVYAFAADDCPGLPWQLVAAIGGTADPKLSAQIDPTTGEVHPPVLGPILNGQGGQPAIADTNQPSGWARREGPFAILSTIWTAYGTPAPDTGRSNPDPQNAWDSTFTLTHALCTYLGNDNGNLAGALAEYDPNPSWDQSVTSLALSYGMAGGAGPAGDGGSGGGGGSGTTPPVPPNGATYSGQVAAVIAAAESQLGIPYKWGAESPGKGFDCSGLIQWAYAQAGISLPRVTYSQADVGTEVPKPWAANVAPGDLLLMPGVDNGVTTPLGHIAMAIGGGLMIQAPYTGTVVQIDPIPWSDVELIRRVIS
jgi:cell wall-associated NlpC family hydrolase